MPPKRHAAQDPMDVLEQRISQLERLVKELQTNKVLTVPSYDPTNFPTNSVEGQVAVGTDDILNWFSSGAWHQPSGAGAATEFGLHSYEPPLWVYHGIANNLLAGPGMGWTYDTSASPHGGYMTRGTSPALNDQFGFLVPLYPKGAGFGITYAAYGGPDYGKITVEMASLTYQDAARGSGSSLGKIQDVEDFPHPNLNASYGTSPVVVGVDSGVDWYNSTSFFGNYGGTLQFQVGGNEGDQLTNMCSTTDPYTGFCIMNGGPGWYVIRLRVSGKNSSSTGFRMRVGAVAVLRVGDGSDI